MTGFQFRFDPSVFQHAGQQGRMSSTPGDGVFLPAGYTLRISAMDSVSPTTCNPLSLYFSNRSLTCRSIWIEPGHNPQW